MKTISLCVIALVAIGFMASCSGGIISYDEDMAAKSAVQFAKVAMVQHDVNIGYSLLSETTKKAIPIEKSSEAL